MNKIKLVLVLVSIVAFNWAVKSQNIDLSGSWQFRIDRSDVGIGESWYNQTFDESIELPGSMVERGKGDDISVKTKWVGSLYDSSYYYNPKLEKYRQPGNMKLPFFLTPDKHYVGVAWYKKDVVIESIDKKMEYVVCLERPHIETTLYVNGVQVGKRNSLCVAHKYDITDFIRKGSNTIALRIDNRIETCNVGQDSHSVSDQTQGDWNGIVGKMYIELRPKCNISGLQVYPDIDNNEIKVFFDVKGNLKNAKLSAVVKERTTGKIVTKDALKIKEPGSGSIVIKMPSTTKLWDEFNPFLYNLDLKFISEETTYTHTTVFGMRKIETRGKMIYVNGREVQMRGTVENCDFPLTGYAPMDLESWIKVFETCKSYGLNHMRFHSYCPPEAAFLAADIVGFYLQPEGPSWPNHGVKLGNGQPIDEYLMQETKDIVSEYGNHPSFCMLSCGNEPAGNWVKWVSAFVDYWKATDARRIYTGASVGGGWAWQPRNQYHVKAGARGLNEWKKTAPESVVNFSHNIDSVRAPFISHETGQWCAFPNFDEIKKYTGVNKAKNFEMFRDILSDNGMETRAHDFLMASGKLQLLCYKSEIERTLRTPNYAGFQLLGLNDYSGQGTALVGVTDVFFEDKGYCTANEFRQFCSPIVPLAKFPKFTFVEGETLNIEVEVSQFSNIDLKGVTPHYVIRNMSDNSIVAEGVFEKQDITIGCNKLIGNVVYEVSAPTAAKMNLEIVIPGTSDNNGGLDASNNWNFWVYPNNINDNVGDVFIANEYNEEVERILEHGGKVLICAAGRIVYGKDIHQYFTPVFWNTSWFKMRPPHTTGIYVENNHKIFSQFPTDYHSDMQWWELVNRAQVMQLSDFPIDYQPIIQSIDTWFISRKIGMLVEANVGNGKLIITTMDIVNNLDNRIVARQMRKSILDYMNSSYFNPKWTIADKQIKDLFTKEADKVDMFTKDSPDELKPKIK